MAYFKCKINSCAISRQRTDKTAVRAEEWLVADSNCSSVFKACFIINNSNPVKVMEGLNGSYRQEKSKILEQQHLSDLRQNPEQCFELIFQ